MHIFYLLGKQFCNGFYSFIYPIRAKGQSHSAPFLLSPQGLSIGCFSFFPPILLDDKIITSIQLSLMVQCDRFFRCSKLSFIYYLFFRDQFSIPPTPLLARIVNFHIFHIKTFLIYKT